MNPKILFSAAFLAAAGPVPALAQNLPGNLGSAASQALQSLTSAAQDKLLIKDMLGAEVTGPGGQVIGTVANLVMIPGGRVVAALISTKDKNTGQLAVPFQVVKLSAAAGKVGVSLPMGLSELKGNKDVQALTQAVKSMPGGSGS